MAERWRNHRRLPGNVTSPEARGIDVQLRHRWDLTRFTVRRPAKSRRRELISFCRETRKLLLRQGLTISRTIRPQTDFAGACESRSHKAVCAVRCPGWFVIGSIYRPQLMQEQI